MTKILKKIKLKNSWPVFLIIIVCLALASLFIFDHISARAFWSDEADVANIISQPFSKLAKAAVIDGHPLFYPYILKLWSLIFENNELSLRGFSAVFGLLLIIFFYKAGKDFFQDCKIGLLAAFLGATSYFLIWFATQNKVYTLAAFMGLLSYYFFIKLLNKPEEKDYFFYSISTVVCAYIHPWLILVFLSQIFSTFLIRRKINDSSKIFLAQAIVVILIIPAILITIYQVSLGASAWINKVSLRTFFESLKYLSFGSTWVYFISFLIVAFYIFIYKEKPKDAFSGREIITDLVLTSYLCLPLLLSVIISQFKGAYVLGRYEMIVLPAFILLAASLFSKIENKYILFLILFLVAGFTTKEVIKDRDLVLSYRSTDKTVALDILSRINDGDVVIATDLNFPTFYYYFGRLNKDISKNFSFISFPQEISRHPGWKDLNRMISEKERYEVESAALVESLKGKNYSVWVIYKEGNEINSLLRDKLRQSFKTEEIKYPLAPREPAWFDAVLKFN